MSKYRDLRTFIHAFNSVSDSELTPKLIVFKRIGKIIAYAGMSLFAILYILFDTGRRIDNELIEVLNNISLAMIMLGIVMFGIVGAYAAGRSNGKTSTLAAIWFTVKKAILMIFLPAVLVTCVVLGLRYLIV